MKRKYDYWVPKLELTNLYETSRLIEYIFYRNRITFHNKEIVDLGCGWGANTIRVACGIPKSGYFQIPKMVIGLDCDVEEIERAKEFTKHLSNVQFFCHDITKPFPFNANGVDIFISTYTLHNLQDDYKEKVFQHVERALCKGGYFIYIDVIFDKESERTAILAKNSLEELWRREAYCLEQKELQTLLDVHLDSEHPFSLILTGRKEFPITISKAKSLGEKANLKLIDVTPVKGLVFCKRLILESSEQKCR